jgi:hypothetical protein
MKKTESAKAQTTIPAACHTLSPRATVRFGAHEKANIMHSASKQTGTTHTLASAQKYMSMKGKPAGNSVCLIAYVKNSGMLKTIATPTTHLRRMVEEVWVTI